MHLRNSRWWTYFSESSNEAWFVKIFSHTLGKVGAAVAAIVVGFFAAVFLYALSERRQSQTVYKNTAMITEDNRRFEYPTTTDQDPMPSKPMSSKIERNRSHGFDGSTTLLESYEHFMAMSESPRARLGLYETLKQCDGFGSVRSVEEFDKLATSELRGAIRSVTPGSTSRVKNSRLVKPKSFLISLTATSNLIRRMQ